MTGKRVSFIATKYKNQTPKFSFYTEDGKKVSPDIVERSPEKLEFFISSKPKKAYKPCGVYVT